MSFSDDLTYLQEVLDGSAEIAAIFPAKRQKVVRKFQRRVEINQDELPLIMITRPRAVVTPESNATGLQEHVVALYCGFTCEDREQAQDLLIRFEEAIEQAVMVDPTLGRRVNYIEPGDSANDEGKFHPTYFFVKEIKISKEVTWQP